MVQPQHSAEMVQEQSVGHEIRPVIAVFRVNGMNNHKH